MEECEGEILIGDEVVFSGSIAISTTRSGLFSSWIATAATGVAMGVRMLLAGELTLRLADGRVGKMFVTEANEVSVFKGMGDLV